jgi:hypothetical protein
MIGSYLHQRYRIDAELVSGMAAFIAHLTPCSIGL